MNKTLKIELQPNEPELNELVRKRYNEALSAQLEQHFKPQRVWDNGAWRLTESETLVLIKQLVEEAVAKEIVKREARLQEEVSRAFDAALQAAIEKAAAHAANKLVFNSPDVRNAFSGK